MNEVYLICHFEYDYLEPLRAYLSKEAAEKELSRLKKENPFNFDDNQLENKLCGYCIEEVELKDE